jgi:hypothetical protein
MMKTQNPNLTRKLRLAGMLIIAGLVVQLCSLFWNHPLSFLVFILAGSLITIGGIVTYLFAIVTLPEKDFKETAIKSAELP